MFEITDDLIEIALERSCGCRDTWLVSQLGAEPQVLVVSHPCVPALCQACQTRGEPCEARKGLTGVQSYEPIAFDDVGPRPKYIRMKAG